MSETREPLFSALRIRAQAGRGSAFKTDFFALPKPIQDVLYGIAAELETAAGRLERAERFGEMVLECDRYGCENGPDKCLHADAARFLEELRAAW